MAQGDTLRCCAGGGRSPHLPAMLAGARFSRLSRTTDFPHALQVIRRASSALRVSCKHGPAGCGRRHAGRARYRGWACAAAGAFDCITILNCCP